MPSEIKIQLEDSITYPLTFNATMTTETLNTALAIPQGRHKITFKRGEEEYDYTTSQTGNQTYTNNFFN